MPGMEFIHRPADCGIRRIVFMGTPELAVHVLEALVDTGYEVTLAVTQPDRQKGRGRSVVMPPVKEAAIRAGIPVFQPQKLREPGAFERIAAEQPDLIVVAAFGQILPAQILDLPTGTVTSKYNRALRKMQKEFDGKSSGEMSRPE